MHVGNLMFWYEEGRIHVSDLSFVTPSDAVFFSSEKDPMHSIEIGYPDTDWRIVLQCSQVNQMMCDNDASHQVFKQPIFLNGLRGTVERKSSDYLECYCVHFPIKPQYGCNMFTVQFCTDCKDLNSLPQYGFAQKVIGSIMRNQRK